MKFIICILLMAPLLSDAQLVLADIFSNNMVLQQGKPMRIWGKATPGQKVSVQMGAVQQSAFVKWDSTWLVNLPPQKSNDAPQVISITSANNFVQLSNILIGDVWLCMGQSNMQFAMRDEMHFSSELENASNGQLRFYNPSYAGEGVYGSLFPDSIIQQLQTQLFYKSKWEVCDSTSLPGMSAVAYYFGKEVNAQANIPIGLIDFSIGGAPVETFIAEEALLHHPQFFKKVADNWLLNDALPVWVRERGIQNLGGTTKGFKKVEHPYKPGFAFEKSIAPITALPIKGILWYQGESNAQEWERVTEYSHLMHLMVADYRTRWNMPHMPFYFVQLSSIDTLKYKSALWPQFRNEQRKALQIISHSGMAVSSDVGAVNNVHPTNKKVVGQRLARWALHHQYGKRTLPSGPLPQKAVYKKGEVIVHFKFAGKYLQAAGDKALRGFSIDGKSISEAVIKKKTVKIAVAHKPDSVYYGWQPYTDANLINNEGLPASTFKINVD